MYDAVSLKECKYLTKIKFEIQISIAKVFSEPKPRNCYLTIILKKENKSREEENWFEKNTLSW